MCVFAPVQLSIFSRAGGVLKGDIPITSASRAWVSGDVSWTVCGQLCAHALPCCHLPNPYAFAAMGGLVFLWAGEHCGVLFVLTALVRVWVWGCR